MRLLNDLSLSSLLLLLHFPSLSSHAEPIPPPLQQQQQHRLPPPHQQTQKTHPDQQTPPPQGGVSRPFFAALERTARLVDIAYCVGTTGVSPPFACASRCGDFPTLRLVRTWNTGVLLSDSCGYIAIDHGHGYRGAEEGEGDGFWGGEWEKEEEEKERGSGWGHAADDGGVGSENGRGSGSGREIVVAFRGTYSLTNTIVDLSTVPQEYVPYPAPDDDENGEKGDGPKCDNCTVHMGFMASWRNAREVVIPALKAARAKYPGYRVHLLGHSLGGAVAALAALEVRLALGWEDVLVTTFGEPRVGNGALAEYIDRAFGLLRDGDGGSEEDGNAEGLQYRRVTHVGDPVPLLPLSEWGYRSHAGEVYIGKSSLPPAPEDLSLCHGDRDPECMDGAETTDWLGWLLGRFRPLVLEARTAGRFPARFKVWQLLFAHRDYFWRLGLCLPGGDPADWGRDKYNLTAVEHTEDPEMQDL